MVRIHFCGADEQPLCHGMAGDGWLWTVTPHAVTCRECRAVLDERLAREALDELPDVLGAGAAATGAQAPKIAT